MAKNLNTNSAHRDRERNFEFPEIIKLCREADAAERWADGYLWRIGDALIAECGPPGRHGVNTGTKDKLNKVARELERTGLGRWSLIYLRKLRATAAALVQALVLPADQDQRSMP